MTNKHILVTGGTGLVGSHLLYSLTAKGQKIRALRRPESNIDFVKKVFGYYAENAEYLFSLIEWVEGDVTDYYSLFDAMENVDIVYHTAAIVSFHPADLESMMKINVEGTANVVNAALCRKVKKLCHVSSIATLGRSDTNGLTDEDTHWNNSGKNSGYSKSKYAAELEVWRGTVEGLAAVIVNPSVIIGPGDWNKGSSELFKLVWNGLKFYTDGVNGYVDVRDVAKTMMLLTESDIENERFVISAENIDYLKLFSMMADGFSKDKPSVKVTPLLSNIAWRLEKLRSLISFSRSRITKETVRTSLQKYYYSNEKISNTIGIQFIPIAEAIRHCCDIFMKENKN